MLFEEIYARYFKDVYYFILGLSKDPELAMEITQETFFKVLKSIKKYNDNGHITAWLFSIARNTYFTYCRNKNISFDDSIEVNDKYAENILDKIVEMETVKNIQASWRKLDEPYKTVFKLRIDGNLSFKQIGDALEKSENWARVTFYRAKVKIKEQMEVYENE